MTSNTRLRWVGAILLVSTCYAILVAESPQFAAAISSGYVAVLLTVFIVLNLWKKP